MSRVVGTFPARLPLVFLLGLLHTYYVNHHWNGPVTYIKRADTYMKQGLCNAIISSDCERAVKIYLRCGQCGVVFTARREAKYCSPRCGVHAIRARVF